MNDVVNDAVLRIESLRRDLIVEEGFVSLEQALPASGHAAGLFHACLARLGRQSTDVLAFLAWHGQDPAELQSRSESLRQALLESEHLSGGRMLVTLFVLDAGAVPAEKMLESTRLVRHGHFLEKILVRCAALNLSQGRIAWSGKGKLSPPLKWFEERALRGGLHAADEAERALSRREADESRARRLVGRGDTWATWTLIGLNVLAFAAQRLLPPDWGLNQGSLVFGRREYYRLFTCMFLHGGEWHLIFNMISLFSLGTLLERLSGPLRFLLLYLLSGLLGALLSALNPADPMSLGASGAIFGLAGALMALNWRRPKDFPEALAGRIFGSLLRPVLITFALGISLTLVQGPIRFDNWAHFGGFMAGFVIVLGRPALLSRPAKRRKA